MADSEQSAEFILGVDLDGVVADHTFRFREIMADLRGVDPETMPLERSWDFGEWGLEPDEYAQFHRIAVMEHDMFATMRVIDGAAEALWRLSDAGVWIRIITHQLYTHWGHAKTIADTANWLDTHRIPYRDLCFLGKKPQVEADAYIDDAPHNIEQLRAAGNTVIAFEQPYNRSIDGLRAVNWGEVEAIVTDLAAQHTGQFEAQLPGIDAGSDRLHRNRD